MTRRRARSPIVASLASTGAVAGALLLAAPGFAATVLPADIDALPRGGSVEYGTANLVIAGGAKSKLTSAGVSLSGSGSADVKGTKVSFDTEEKGSLIDVTQMVGAVTVEGGLTAKGRKGTAKLTAITFQPGDEKNVTAKLGGKLIELGSLKGGKAKFSRQADGALSGAKFALTSKAVKALNAKTGGGFSVGSFGTLGIKVTGRELPIKSGVATMTLDPAFLKLITDNGFDLSATAPAARNGNVVTLGLTSGAFDPIGLTGRLTLDGKITISGMFNGTAASLDLFGWRTIVTSTQKDLYASVNSGVAAAIANIDVSTLDSQFEGAGFTAKGAKITLAKISTDVLKQQFGIVVPVGTPMGTVDLTGALSGK